VEAGGVELYALADSGSPVTVAGLNTYTRIDGEEVPGEKSIEGVGAPVENIILKKVTLFQHGRSVGHIDVYPSSSMPADELLLGLPDFEILGL
jgi:hypothetical protein